MVKVEVVYVATEGITTHLYLDLASGALVSDALEKSGVHLTHPETKTLPVGIYSKKVALNTVLKEGDRVEIYRPLAVDPKEKRRIQAKLNKGK